MIMFSISNFSACSVVKNKSMLSIHLLTLPKDQLRPKKVYGTMIDKGQITDLVGFGLTATQAKVFLTLTRLGTAPARVIGNYANIARQDVYSVLDQLHQLGLVEKVIDSPLKYRPVDIKDCITVLLTKRSDETVNLTQTAEKLIDSIQRVEEAKYNPIDLSLVLLNNKNALLRRSRKAIEQSTTEICFVTIFDAFAYWATLHVDNFEQALLRGVKIKFVFEKPQKKFGLPRELKELCKHQSFQIKCVASAPKAVIGLFDDKLMFTTISTANLRNEYVRLWSDQPSMIELGRSYFDKYWSSATKLKQNKR